MSDYCKFDIIFLVKNQNEIIIISIRVTAEAMPSEVWTHTLTHLTPRHFPNFNSTCILFNEIYEGGWKELFKAHFSTCEPKDGETWKAAYQREYRFPLCKMRT